MGGIRELFKLRRNVMHVNRLTVDDGPARHRSAADGRALKTLQQARPAEGRNAKDTPVLLKDRNVLNITQPSGVRSNRVQDGLQVGWRAGDDAKDFARRGLLLQRLF